MFEIEAVECGQGDVEKRRRILQHILLLCGQGGRVKSGKIGGQGRVVKHWLSRITVLMAVSTPLPCNILVLIQER